jgi:WD40 repeat protein
MAVRSPDSSRCFGLATRDETILTGDSRGVFSVWDPATTSEVYSLKSHDADVLAMAYSVQPDSGVVVIATGADSNMVCLRRTPSSGTASPHSCISRSRIQPSLLLVCLF